MLVRENAIRLSMLTATMCLVWICVVYRAIAQESLGETPTLSRERLDNDPLFQELKKAFLPSTERPTAATPSSQKRTVSGLRWKAAECLLKAARLLEQESRQQLERNEMDEHNQTKKEIQAIRAQVIVLLGSPTE